MTLLSTQWVQSALLLILLLCTCGCAQSGPGAPPEDLATLAPLVAELQVADAMANKAPVVIRDSVREEYYDRVLAAHGTSRDEFDERMWRIRREPAWIDTLYTRVGEIILAAEKDAGL